ncbi:MAG: AAA family ATPase, partial [Muribaculaceae bacterium]|nr:AAA family ATPase [Muribaculaceae bacterium]
MEKIVKYPIGQQDFKTLRERGDLYVDKTRYLQTVLNSSQYLFLARPRRFGKSLFLSTLRYFFEGRRDLFKGLYIDTIERDWTPNPVLHFDLNQERYAEPGVLDRVADNMFHDWEVKYDIDVKSDDLSIRFRNIIKGAHEKTGKQVVILVDEYDKPLVGNLNEMENFEHYRSKLAAIYSNFKSSAEHIRLVFLTGVSRFSKLSVFSDLNNLNDITFDNEYADICGITERELFDSFHIGIKKLAENYSLSYDKAASLLKRNYDGYRFAAKGSDIYNPWSLLNCLAKSDIGNYWNGTGRPTLIVEALKRINADLQSYFNSTCSDDELRGLDLLDPQPLALLYQTGYLTIKD